jgi:hypothetical protein
MTPVEKLEMERRRGEDALHIVEHPLFNESIETLKDAILKQWAASPMRDIEGRESLHQMYRLVDSVKNNLVSIMQTGQMASTQLIPAESRTRKLLEG